MISNMTIKSAYKIHLPACDLSSTLHPVRHTAKLWAGNLGMKASNITTMGNIHVRRTPACTTPIYGYDPTTYTSADATTHHTTNSTFTTINKDISHLPNTLSRRPHMRLRQLIPVTITDIVTTQLNWGGGLAAIRSGKMVG